MATKNVTLSNLTSYNEKIKAKYATKAELPTKVSELNNDSNFQTGTQVSSAISSAIENKADKGTTLADYGIQDAATKDELAGVAGSVYRPAGSVATLADVPAPDKAHVGAVYNVQAAFTTNASFVEGAGDKHPKGTNVVVVELTPEIPESEEGAGDGTPATYGYDVLAGFVDLSPYAKSEDLTDVVRTGDFEEITEQEIENLFADGTGTGGNQE